MMRNPRREMPSGRCRRPAVLAVTALLLASGCGLPHRGEAAGSATSPPAAVPSTPPAPTGTPYGGLPDPADVDRSDPTAVSRAAVQTMWTVDAVIDRGQGDAYRRALPYLTGQYAERLQTLPLGGVPPAWRDHHAYARVRLSPQTLEDGAPPDNARTAHRQWEVTVTPTGRDGWKGTATRAIVFVTLTSDAEDIWRVSAVTTA
ncbi:hypothetical protein [Actinomadura sp. NPDC049753]|uniref:hypothetical protein n=1 Tax=Actinomadura sp. NPDC049753 TaxID=3154739 RepID=UPI0034129D0A